MPTRLIGYARVSTRDQSLAPQRDALQSAGCHRVYVDKVSGARRARPGLRAALRAVKPSDTLVVVRLDRLGRSLPHLVEVVTDLRERGVHFKSLDDGMVDTTTASGELVFHLFAALAQFERELVRERTRAGLEAAKARGRKGGRKPVRPDDPRVQAAVDLHATGRPVAEVCQVLGVSRATLYRRLELARRVGETR